MLMDDEKIISERNELTSELQSIHLPYSWDKKIIVPKKELLKIHNKILIKKNAIALVYFDIILSNNIKNNFDKDYFDLLKSDLDILMDLIIYYITPIVNSFSETLLKNDSKELLIKSFKRKAFDSKLLNDRFCFDYYFGTLLTKNGNLEELYYSLPDNLKSEELSASLYKKMSVQGLSIAYYANYLYECDDIGKTFYGNKNIDLISLELGNRSDEEIFTFLESIIKAPCLYTIGAVMCFDYLINKFSHDFLTKYIYNLRFKKGFNNLEEDDLNIIYKCLLEAENRKLQKSLKKIK